jgi:hypothetical protein
VYRRRRPETTALYRVVQTHLETWLVERSACELSPRYVEEDFCRNENALTVGVIICDVHVPKINGVEAVK